MPLAPEYNMGGFLRRNELNAFVSQGAHVNPLEQSLSPPSRTGEIATCSSSMRPVRRYCWIVLGPPPMRTSIPLAASARPVKRLVNTARDEVECRSAFHLDGRARVMSQDESWNVIGWVVPPPAFPVHVGPGTANRSEHVSSENPGANILEAPRSEVVIDPRCATVGAI